MKLWSNEELCKPGGLFSIVEPDEASGGDTAAAILSVLGTVAQAAVQGKVDRDTAAAQRSAAAAERQRQQQAALTQQRALAQQSSSNSQTANAAGSSDVVRNNVSPSRNTAERSDIGRSTNPKSTYLHDPLAEAHNCLSLIKDGLYGGFINSCGFKVHYGYCVYKPKKGSWTDSSFFDCERDMAQKGYGPGGQTVGANSRDGNHTRGGQKVLWFACKDDAYPEELHFDGSKINGKCVHR